MTIITVKYKKNLNILLICKKKKIKCNKIFLKNTKKNKEYFVTKYFINYFLIILLKIYIYNKP